MTQSDSTSANSRIALVSGGLALGGATTFLCNFAGELVRRKIPVNVLSFTPENPLASDFMRLAIPVFHPGERRLIFEDRMRALLQELKRFQPTMVLANLGAESFESLRYLPRGILRVGILHADDPAVYKMVRHYSGEIDLIAVVSETIRSTTAALSEFKHMPVRYLPLGVPMPTENSVPAIDAGRPLRILYLGRLSQDQKRVLLFPDIFVQLKASSIPFHWTLIGDGPERAQLEKAMHNSSATQQVSFLGQIPYADVPRMIQSHDVFLLASDYEGLPLSLLEAMGCGLVPVVSDLESGVREIVDSTNGILVPMLDVAGYARAIIYLHKHRDELAAKSKAARERVQTEFSVAAMTDRWLAALSVSNSPIVEWPKSWKITAPLTAVNPVQFSGALRALRRIRARMRN